MNEDKVSLSVTAASWPASSKPSPQPLIGYPGHIRWYCVHLVALELILYIFNVGAVTTSFGRLFQDDTTLIEKKCFLIPLWHRCFFRFNGWPRVMFSFISKNRSCPIASLSFINVYVCIISLRKSMYESDGIYRIPNLSLYDKCLTQ